jgi:hypothetical protein
MDPTFAPIIRIQSDLEAAWHHLMGPWGFGGASIWMLVVLADDRVLPHLTEIAEADEPPDAAGVARFAEVLAGLDLEPGDRLAFLRSRPGGPAVTAADRAWAASLYAGARAAGVPCEVVHLATEGDVRPLPADELPATA